MYTLASFILTALHKSVNKIPSKSTVSCSLPAICMQQDLISLSKEACIPEGEVERVRERLLKQKRRTKSDCKKTVSEVRGESQTLKLLKRKFGLKVDMKTDYNKKKKTGQGACNLSALNEKLIAIKKTKHIKTNSPDSPASMGCQEIRI